VSNSNVTANSAIVITLKALGGSGPTTNDPFLTAITPSTGFSVAAQTGDTSTYNYLIMG
jgi:hypothetical protein